MVWGEIKFNGSKYVLKKSLRNRLLFKFIREEVFWNAVVYWNRMRSRTQVREMREAI